MEFSEKVVLITGTSRGIGRAIAEAFAHQGAQLSLIDILPMEGEAGILSESAKTKVREGDISLEADRKAWIEDAIRQWGRVDVLINNAAISGGGSALEVGLEHWQRVMDVNLTAPMALAALCASYMPEGGAVVNVASVQGLLAEQQNAAYNSSKAGLINLTRSLALDMAPLGVRVNAVAPGAIATEKLLDAIAKHPDPEQTQQDWQDLHALQRFGLPAEVAEAVLFLASPRASFITGATLPVDGGMTASFMMAGRPV